MKLEKLRRLLLAPLGLAMVSSIYSQQQAAEAESDDDDVFELSPFTVDASEDIGYWATSTLAGTRIKTNLRDVGASVSILTEAFLQDTASLDIEDVLVMAGNTEVGGLGGNFSGSQGFGAGNVIPELQRDTNNGGITRVRGLASADLTRNYFLTSIPFDTYNTDRITVQRGANAALFGLGSPGGVINNNLILANFANSGRIQYRTDEHGSQRLSFRKNEVLVDDVFSVFVAGLAEEEKFEQQEAWSRDRRLYTAFLWQPAETFRIRASAEFGNIDSAKPRFTPPVDLLSSWFDYGKPTFATPEEAGAFRLGTGDIVDGVPNNRFFVPIGPARRGPMTVYGDPSSPNPTHGVQAFVDRNQFADGMERTMLSVREEFTIARAFGFRPDGSAVDPAVSRFYARGLTDKQILDRSIFDYRKHLLDGGASTQFADFRDIKLSIEKTWFDEQLGLELAFSEETWDDGQFNQLRGNTTGKGIMIDMNEFLGASDDGEMIPNPNFGGAAIVSLAENALLSNDKESMRATLFANVEFSDFIKSDRISEILGRMTLTTNSQFRRLADSEAFSRDGPDYNTIANALGDGTVGSLSADTFRAYQYHALEIRGLPEGQTLLDLNSKEDLRGLDIQPIPFGNLKTQLPESGTFLMWDRVNEQWEEVTTGLNTIRDNNGIPAIFFAGKSETEVTSHVAILQHYLWNDNIVLQGSWRQDEQDEFSAGGAPRLPDNSRASNVLDPSWVIPDNPTDTASGQIRTWSAVVHTPNFIKERLPAGLDLSLHFSEGENFEPTAGRLDIFGRGIPPVSGTTEETGFTISAFENKLIAKFNWYETAIAFDSFDGGAYSAPEGILLNLARQLDNPDNVAQGFTAADAQAVLPVQSVIDLQGVTFDWANAEATSNPNPARAGSRDFVSDGMEVEISYFPKPNWNNMIVIARQETVQSNTAPVLEQWVNDFVRPQWIESNFAKNYFINDESTETLAQRAQAQIETFLIAQQATDGNPSIEQREWTINATSSYRFTGDEDWFPSWTDGLTVGASLRWEDEAGVGFGVTTDPVGNFIPDLSQPLMADSQTFFDVFARYEFNLRNDLRMSVQVNIDDVTDHSDDLVPIYANPDDTRIYRIQEGRLTSLTATLHF